MPKVNIKGFGIAKFPDDMPINDIRGFLRNKYSQRAIGGESDILSPVQNVAAPYKPTLVERMGTGIADTLKDTGIISDNYGAQRIGKNIAGIGEFLPGIGDATAGDEFGRAVAEGDGLGIAMAGLGVIPVAGDLAKNAVKLGKSKLPKTINIKGVNRPTSNSDGDPLGETESDIIKFWDWFGDSTVTDNYGKPKVVYHGTGSEFSEFDAKKSDGFWFTDNKDLLTGEGSDIGASSANSIIPAYLKIELPDVNGPNYDIEDHLEDGEFDGVTNLYEYGEDHSVITNEQIRQLPRIKNN
jgi:hypothetical protein